MPFRIASYSDTDGLEQPGKESAINSISLSPSPHTYWNKGEFALKPISISADKKSLTVQFFWQVKQYLVMPKINLTTIPISTRDLDEYEDNCLTNDIRLIRVNV